jgi:hypothetical protein
MVALNGLQVHETADSQPLLVALSPVNHSKNMRGKNLPCLEHDGPITLLKLLVNGKSAFVSGAFSWVSILFSPRNLKLQQPQLPRAGSNGQPAESSHLAALITSLRRLGAHRLLRRRGLALLLPLCILR